MGILSILTTLIFLIGPGVFFLICATSQLNWWQSEIDKLKSSWLSDKKAGNLKTLTLIVGITLTAIGAIVLASNLYGEFSSGGGSAQVAPSSTPARKSPSKSSRRRSPPARRLYKGPKGGKFIRVRKDGRLVRQYV